MLNQYNIPIIICELEDEVLEKTKNLLSNNGFNNIYLLHDIQELLDLDYVESLDVPPLVIIELNNKYNVSSLATIQAIKCLIPKATIIGLVENVGDMWSISIEALQAGCSSCVEKNNYELELINKVKLWTKYIKERNMLMKLLK